MNAVADRSETVCDRSMEKRDLVVFKEKCELLIKEFFVHLDQEELAKTLQELFEENEGGKERGETFVKAVISICLDRGNKERESSMRLLEKLKQRKSFERSSSDDDDVNDDDDDGSEFFLPAEAFEGAFDYVLAMLADVEIDVPTALDDVSKFLARAVIDDVLSVTYLEERVNGNGGISERGVVAAKLAKKLLEAPGGDAVVRNSWGGEGIGENRVDVLRDRVKKITYEYFQSLDCKEYSRNVRVLNVPFYHHEVVYRLLSVAIERDLIDKSAGKQTMDVLKYLGREGVINSSQMAKGFARTVTRLRELALDYPNAPETFERLAETAKSRGLLPTGLSTWATLKATTTRSSHGLRKQLVRLDSAEDLLALAHENRRRYNNSPLGTGIISNDNNNIIINNNTRTRGPADIVENMSSTLQISPATQRFRERRKNKMLENNKALLFRGADNTTSGDSGDSDGGVPSRSQSPQPTSARRQPMSARQISPRHNIFESTLLRSALSSEDIISKVDVTTTMPTTWRKKFALSKEYLRTLREMRARDNHVKHVAEGTSHKMRRRNSATYYALNGNFSNKTSTSVGGNNRPFLRRSHSSPGGLRELEELSKFVSDVGKVHDYLPFGDRYEVGETMGKGGFAIVRKAKHKASNEIVAVKTISIKEAMESDDDKGSKNDSDSDDDSDSESEEFEAMTTEEVLNELALMQRLSRHPHIVTIREFFTEQNGAVIHVVMDLLKGQELEDAISEQPNGRFPEAIAKKMIHHLLDAVAFMHTKGVIHRDLKLENIVLREKDDYDTVTIVDFGLAKVLRTRQTSAGVDGTVAYVSPEALLQGTYGQGVDVWACGVALFVLLTGEWPFEDEDEDELIELICEANIEYVLFDFSGVSDTAKDLLSGLLEPNPKRRLSAAAALEHAWFNPNQENNSCQRLRRVHGKLEAYSYVEHQLPERRFAEGEYLCKKGEPCEETFLITSGECVVVESGTASDENSLLRFRRASNFVGELDPEAKTYSVSVKAKENTRALVFTRDDIEWANKSDYRLTEAFNNIIRERRREVAKYEAKLRAVTKAKERIETRPQTEVLRRL